MIEPGIQCTIQHLALLKLMNAMRSTFWGHPLLKDSLIVRIAYRSNEL